MSLCSISILASVVHDVTVYVAPRIGKDFIRRWFNSLRGATYGFLKTHGKILGMSPKNPAAVSLGRKGGHARAKKLTAEERSESARKAVEARWEKQKADLKQLVGEITEGTKRLEKKALAGVARAKAKKADLRQF
jgi:hypothetical protein